MDHQKLAAIELVDPRLQLSERNVNGSLNRSRAHFAWLPHVQHGDPVAFVLPQLEKSCTVICGMYSSGKPFLIHLRLARSLTLV